MTLFRLFGFEVRLDASWLVIAALVCWSLAAGIFPGEFPGLSAATYWWMGIVGALAFFGSIVAHELCHSLVANYYHLPMRGITLFIFGGVAEMGGEPQSPKVEFLMAIAGPIASVVLGGLFYAGYVAVRGGPVEAAAILSYLAWINWLLAGFNLIPAFPLDGGRVLRSAIWQRKGDLTRATEIASRIGSGFGYALMAWGLYELFRGALISAVWYFLLGTFLRHAARTSYEQVLIQGALSGETVRRFMRPNPVAVRPDLSIHQFVDDYLYRYDYKLYPVVEDSQDLVGCVTTADLRDVPKEDWDRRRVAEVARPCSEANTVSPDTDAMKALAKIQQTGGTTLLVTERKHLVAIVSARDVLNFLAAKLRLEGRPTPLLPSPRA